VVDDARPEPFPQTVVRALADEVEVEVTERRQEAVGVVRLPLGVGGADVESVAREGRDRHLGFEEPAVVDAPHAHKATCVRDRHLERVGVVRAHHGDVAARVRAEHLVRIAVHAIGELARRLGEVERGLRVARRGHAVASTRKPTGTATQLGRWAIS
jgi:hypothetical protein